MSCSSLRCRRYAVLCHYSGGGAPFCVCCGETHLEFLALDHIRGGGNVHRRMIGKSTQLHLWLHRNGYPDGYRVLCHNCNCSRGFYGYCPHVDGAKLQAKVTECQKRTINKGEYHGMARLTNNDVLVIREYLAAGIAQSEIAAVFHVTKGIINHISTGYQWGSV